MFSPRRLARTVCTLLACALATLLPSAVSAAPVPYDSGAYGRCSYSIGCAPQHTITTTPGGLQIALNLTPGQTIPAGSTYTLIVTPLNGAGSSFVQAVIYIDGHAVATILPGSDGSASWNWDTSRYPGSQVKVVATDQTGQTGSVTVAVNLSAATGSLPAGGTTSAPLNPGSGGRPPFLLASLETFNTSAGKLVSQLPKPVVYGFPWLLLLLLALEILVLLLQTKRELHEQRLIGQQTAREQEVARLKLTFSQLISHYLRTPLTIMNGGADMVGGEAAASANLPALQTALGHLSTTIEALIADAIAMGAAGSVSQPALAPSRPWWRPVLRQVAIWLPVILVAFVAYDFLYVANHASRFQAGTLAIAVHVALFTLGVITIFQVARRWQLHRRDTRRAQTMLDQEQRIQAAQDEFIATAATRLGTAIEPLVNLATALPAGKGADFVRQGLAELRTVQEKFVTATRLKGGHDTAPLQTTTAQSLYDQASAAPAQVAAGRQVRLRLAGDTKLPLRNPGLVALVLHSLIDNAVAYSQTGGEVTVAADTEQTTASVTVTNTGRGISPAKLDLLSRPFSRAEGAEDFTHEGMGFSLYLDKLILAYLGGSLDIQSEPGKQTTVTATWSTADA